MVILSKKEHEALIGRIETLSLNNDMLTEKIKEIERRIALLEMTPKRERNAQAVFDEWINGEKREVKP